MDEIIESFNVVNIVANFTRKNAVLDQCFVSKATVITMSTKIIEPLASSDHNIVLIYKNNTVKNNTKQKLQVLDLRTKNLTQFFQQLNGINWSNLYQSNSLETKVQIFYEHLQNTLSFIPKRRIVIHSKDKPWIDNQCRFLIQERWHAYKNKNWTLYKHFKIKTKEYIIKRKKEWAKQSIKQKKNIWSVIKQERKASVDHSLNNIFKNYGNKISSLNAINDMFTTVFNPSPPQECYEYQKEDFPNSDLISVHELYDFLEKMDFKKCVKNDSIPKCVYKVSYPFVVKPLTHIFNHSFQAQAVPTTWKINEIRPIPKTKQPSLSQLRPISLLPLPMRVLEKFLLKRIKPTIINHIGPSQFGFVPHSSTQCALIKVVDSATRLLELPSIQAVTIATFDFSKAFDKVDHKILIEKLRPVLKPYYLNWIKSFLSERYQFTSFNGLQSNMCKVTSGVPQGSAISPLLFNIYINDLEFSPPFYTIKYADDVTVVAPHHSLGEDPMPQIISNIEKWCSANKISINTQKTQVLTIKSTKRTPLYEIPRSNNITILGLIIQNNLKWDEQVSHVIKKSSKNLHILRKLRTTLEKKDLILLFYSFILSILEYSYCVYGNLPQKLMKKFKRQINRAHYIICGNQCLQNCLPSIEQRQHNSCLKLLTNVLINKGHKLHELAPRKLTNSNQLIQEKFHSSRRQRQFIPNSIMLFNKEKKKH